MALRSQLTITYIYCRLWFAMATIHSEMSQAQVLMLLTITRVAIQIQHITKVLAHNYGHQEQMMLS